MPIFVLYFSSKNSIKTTSCALFSLRNNLYSFKLTQIYNLNSYRTTIPFSPYNATSRHRRTYKGATASFKGTSNRFPNSRKEKDTILICTASSFHLTFSTFPAFESHSLIIYLLLIIWCKIGVNFLRETSQTLDNTVLLLVQSFCCRGR